MRGPALALLLLLTTSACGGAPTERSQESRLPVWTLTGLADPESAAIGPDGHTLYVANVNGESDAHDGNGFISRASMDGRMLQRTWVTGLDAPKGAVVAGDRLYVSDIDKLVEIDIPHARIAARYPAPGGKFLNDVAVAPDGTVLVSDSAADCIYALDHGKLVVWSSDPELKSANGLLPEPGRLMAVTMQGKLLAIDYRTRRAQVVATGLGQGDGLAPADGENYFVSEWPGRLFRVTFDGKVDVLLDTRAKGTYINDLIRVGDLVILPNMKPGQLSAYRVTPWMLTEADASRLPPQLQRGMM
jgi:DNA-binding beta-propeller fold protein YncE